MNKVLLLSLLALGCQNASAQLVTESFGGGDSAFTMDFVTIGNPNNAADTTGYPNPVGSVSYKYNIGRYEVCRDIIEKANLGGALGITMYDMANNGGNGLYKPATGISWFEAAKFVNYLNTISGSTAAYKFDGNGSFQLWAPGDNGYDAKNQYRNKLAKYFLPSRDEWYKAAYGSPNGNWYNYATESDANPEAVAYGTSGNTAVYSQSHGSGPADIANAGRYSGWGTTAQGGNVWEYMENSVDGLNINPNDDREVRGGAFYDGVGWLASNANYFYPVNDERSYALGFRVAAVPEPSAFSLLAVGLGGLAMFQRRGS